MSYRANIISVENSVYNTTLAPGETWTGRIQNVTQWSSASIALKSSNNTQGTIIYETSMDQNNWSQISKSVANSSDEGTDIKWRIDEVSDNGTVAAGSFDYVLIRKD